MQKKIMRIIGILGCFILMISMVPLTASAEELPAPEHSKYVTLNDDGTYTLTLDVTGKENTESVENPADILLIVDVSGSMDEMMGGKTRLGIVKSLVSNMATELLPEGSANQMSVVSFSGTKYDRGERWNDAFDVCDWTGSASKITSRVNDLSVKSGTNWEAGFMKGKSKLDTSRSGVQKYVIFLSDGNPTYHYNDDGVSVGEGDATNDDDVTEAIAAAQAITGATIYSVGIGGDVNRMKDVASSVSGAYFDGTSEDALENAFGAIESQITRNYTGVVILDKLSAYADMADPENLRVSAVDAQGNAVDIPEGTSESYDSDNRSVTLSFPSNYVLKSNVTYSVSFEISPSQAAVDQYAELGRTYPNKGDDGTGETSAGKDGFYSNDSATLSYVKMTGTNSENLSVDYPMPVIQLAIEPITELPKAGGPGVYWLFAIGFGMITFAGTLLIIQKKRLESRNGGGLYD